MHHGRISVNEHKLRIELNHEFGIGIYVQIKLLFNFADDPVDINHRVQLKASQSIFIFFGFLIDIYG